MRLSSEAGDETARCCRLAAVVAGFSALIAAPCAQALTIIPVYDSSITSRANASTIEAAFNAVASEFDHAYARNVTVKIGVSWGAVEGQALPSGDIGASRMPLMTGYAYSNIVSMFRADATANPADANMALLAAHLPATSPAGSLHYYIPYAEAQAVGYLPATLSGDSGYVGFSSTAVWDFNPSDGIASNAFDFEGLAAHEISEVLGRITGLYTSSPSYATPIDALRYSAPGVSSFSYSQSAYFSINGGVTNYGSFNASGGGDRTDWQSITGDAQNAYLAIGKSYALTAADKTLLDILGWGVASSTVTIGSVAPGGPTTGFGSGIAAVPEPVGWATMLVGLGLIGATARGRARPAHALRSS